MLKFDTLELLISTNYGMIIGTSKNELLKDYNICLCGCVCVCSQNYENARQHYVILGKEKADNKRYIKRFLFHKGSRAKET